MARMASKVRREFDAEATITLRDLDDGAEAADAAEAGVALNTLKDAYWDNDEVPQGIFLVNVHVSALGTYESGETVDLYVEVDTSNSFASAVEVARLKNVQVGGVGFYEIPVSSNNIEKLEPGATHIRIRADLTGDADTESVSYGAWMTFLAH